MSQTVRIDVADLDYALCIAMREQREYERGMMRETDSPYVARLQNVVDALRAGGRVAVDYDAPSMTETIDRPAI